MPASRTLANIIASNLRQLTQRANLNIKELAGRAEVDCDTMVRLIYGTASRVEFTPQILEKVAAVLQVAPWQLLIPFEAVEKAEADALLPKLVDIFVNLTANGRETVMRVAAAEQRYLERIMGTTPPLPQ